MKIVNLTPHPIRLVANGIEHRIPSSGVARVAVSDIEVGEADGIPLFRQEYGDVVGLPDPTPHTLYIVSAVVRAALPQRGDLVSPARLIRDENGRVIGAGGLATN